MDAGWRWQLQPVGRLRRGAGLTLRWLAERLIDAGEVLLNLAMRILYPKGRRR